MPILKCPTPFYDILKGYISQGRHPGEFILACLAGNPLSHLVSLADDWNAKNLWHIGGIIREYVPTNFRSIDPNYHMRVMMEGDKDLSSLTPSDQSWYQFCKSWDVPDYVERISEPPPIRLETEYGYLMELRGPESVPNVVNLMESMFGDIPQISAPPPQKTEEDTDKPTEEDDKE